MLGMPGESEKPNSRTSTAILDLLVQKRVAEVLAARDGLAAEPFFQSRHVAYEILRLQSVPERKKWAIYFERHGCIVCGSRERSYGSTGFCAFCKQQVYVRLNAILSELMNERAGEIASENFE